MLLLLSIGRADSLHSIMKEDKMKILVVDDNQDISWFTETVLSYEKHDVKTAKNGDDGYSASRYFKPDIVITDIQMPHRNGFEMMKNIRSHQPHIKAIYMSANIDLYQSRLEMEKVKHGAVLLKKPFRRTDLLRAVSTM